MAESLLLTKAPNLPFPFPAHVLRRPLVKSPSNQRSLSSQPKQKNESYSWEITYNLLLAEGTGLPDPDYMKKQQEITSKTRAVLIDWLISQHSALKLLPETLFLSISILDRVLAKDSLPKAKIQLLGLAALMVASKYEEVQLPPLRQFLEMASGYSKQELLVMERKILTVLEFHISRPSAYVFFTRAVSLTAEDPVTVSLGQYLLEQTLTEYSFLERKPSIVACAAIYLARKLRHRIPVWPEVLEKQFNYQESDLQKPAKSLFVVWQTAETHALQSIRTKFTSGVYHEVAKLKISPRK